MGEDAAGHGPEGYTVAALDAATWDAYARLVERHGGVWGGCWCTWFHTTSAEKRLAVEGNRELKERLVREGRAHAALVLHGEEVVAWCQYGSPAELPNIKHRKAYLAGAAASGEAPPDVRITCFFVDRGHRHHGLTALALRGALDQIALTGGGVVESFPQDTSSGRTSGSFLHNATLAVFERAGFEVVRRLGLHHALVRRTVPAAHPPRVGDGPRRPL